MSKAWYSMTAAETAAELKSDMQNGINAAEAADRLKQYGPNHLREKPAPTMWAMFIDQFKDFLILILIAACAVSVMLGEIVDSVVIAAIVVLNAIMGVVQEARATKALDALKKLAAPHAKVIRDGIETTIPAEDLVPGDVVVLEAGDFLPADLRLIESFNLKIDEAALTGESVPAEKVAHDVYDGDIAVADQRNLCFMGTIVTYGRAVGVVIATGMGTEIGKIAEMLGDEEGETPLQRKLAVLGKQIGMLVLGICVVVFGVGVLRGDHVMEVFMVAVSLAVAAIPEGLPAIVTIVLALGVQRMVKRNAIIKKLHAVETLGSTTVICSDKTGTLTQNAMTAVQLFTGERLIDISGEGYRPEGQFVGEYGPVTADSDANLKLLLTAGALCNDSKLIHNTSGEAGEKEWQLIGDPTEGALVVAAAKTALKKSEMEETLPRVQEIPFDSGRKRMTTFHAKPGGGYFAFVKGAPDMLIDLCTMWRNGETRPLTASDKERILRVNSDMASRALRVLAVAYKEMPEVPEQPTVENTECDLVFLGLIGMIDPARPEVIEAISLCKQAGIRPVMITGDNKDTAVAIATQIGLTEDPKRVMTGKELDDLSPEEMVQRVADVDVFARVSPENKVQIVTALKQRGEIVAMTGDGVNDAPALKRADIGVAMGITGTDVAKEASHMIVTDDNFASIVSAVEEGRVIYGNIRKFVYYLLAANTAEVLIVFITMLADLPIPLTPIQLLWINLLTDAFPALALAMERGERDIMQQAPRDPQEPILNKVARRIILVQSLSMTAAVVAVFVQGLGHYAYLGTEEQVMTAHTIAFASMALAELPLAYSCRSEHHTVNYIGWFTNKYMLWAVVFSAIMVLITIYVPPMRVLFGTAFLGLDELAFVIAAGVFPFFVSECAKFLCFKAMDTKTKPQQPNQTANM